MATNSVNDYLVCRYLQSGNYPGQFPYGQGAAAAAVAEEETTLAPPADQAVTGDEEEDGRGGGGEDNNGDSDGNYRRTKESSFVSFLLIHFCMSCLFKMHIHNTF
jgi:hypothetical protein